MKKIKAIIFDMDGVLIDTERISFQSFKEAFKDYKYEMNEEFYLKLIGRNSKSIKEIMLEQYGIDFPLMKYIRKKLNWP